MPGGDGLTPKLFLAMWDGLGYQLLNAYRFAIENKELHSSALLL